MRIRSPRARALIVAGGFVLAAFLAARGPRALGWTPRFLTNAQAQLSAVSASASRWSAALAQTIRDPGALRAFEAEVADIRSRNAAIERRLAELTALTGRLDGLPVFPERPGSFIPARIVAAASSATAQEITVTYESSGGRDPAVGDPVLAGGALIGTVAAAHGRRSVVQLLGDPNARIGTSLPVSAATIGIVEASVGGGLTLTHIPVERDLADGMTVVTNAMDPHIPPGIPIGVIRDLRNGTDGFFRTATIVPLADPHDALVVFIRTATP